MKKTLKLLVLILVVTMLIPFTIVNATTTKNKTEEIVESLKEIVKSFDGTVNYEDDTIEIEWNTQNSNSNMFSFPYNGSVIEYNPGEITSYEEATQVSSHSIYAIYLIKSALRVNGYTDEQIQKFLSSEDSKPTYELNGIEITQNGEAKTFTSEDGYSTITISPIIIRIDVTRANLNTSNEEPVVSKTTTIEDIIEDLQSDNIFTTTEYEGKVISENEIYDDEDAIIINNTYYWEDYHNVMFNCEDGILLYDDEEIESYDDAERASSHHMFASQILTIALKNNGYTIEQIQEFFSSEDNQLDYDLNGIEFKEIGDSKEFTSSDETAKLTVSPMSIKIDFAKANLNTSSNENKTKEEYNLNSSTNSGDSISFTENEGIVYSFYIKDRLATTDEELQQIVDLIDDPEYTFDILKAQLNKLIGYGKSAAGENGTLLKLYEVYLYDNGVEIHNVDGGFKLKLKMTDDMKGYDSYKLVYIADDGTTEKAIELTKNGEYLEGILPHLSMYALVGSKTETATTDTNTTQEGTNASTETATNTSNNPKTGDNIITIFSIFAISTLGALTTIKLNRNYKVTKH